MWLFSAQSANTNEDNRDCESIQWTSQIVVSSTYFTTSSDTVRSLTITKNNAGPSFVPWRTPALTYFQSEKWQPTRVLCLRPVRKLAIQLISTGWTSTVISSFNKMSWPMRSNAFKKSRRQIPTMGPTSSVASYLMKQVHEHHGGAVNFEWARLQRVDLVNHGLQQPFIRKWLENLAYNRHKEIGL